MLPGGIVTAYNPRSELLAPAQNRDAHRRLRSRLLGAGAKILPTLALDGDGRSREWNEPGYLALEITRELLTEIAHALGQNAIVWVDHTGIPTLVAVRPGFCGARPGDILTIP